MRRTAATQNTSSGYRVIEAEQRKAAVAILEQGEQKIDPSFTDVMMPGGLDGYELARLTLERWPGIRILLTSGFAGDKMHGDGDPAANLNLLKKPYRFDDLRVRSANF